MLERVESLENEAEKILNYPITDNAEDCGYWAELADKHMTACIECLSENNLSEDQVQIRLINMVMRLLSVVTTHLIASGFSIENLNTLGYSPLERCHLIINHYLPFLTEYPKEFIDCITIYCILKSDVDHANVMKQYRTEEVRSMQDAITFLGDNLFCENVNSDPVNLIPQKFMKVLDCLVDPDDKNVTVIREELIIAINAYATRYDNLTREGRYLQLVISEETLPAALKLARAIYPAELCNAVISFNKIIEILLEKPLLKENNPKKFAQGYRILMQILKLKTITLNELQDKKLVAILNAASKICSYGWKLTNQRMQNKENNPSFEISIYINHYMATVDILIEEYTKRDQIKFAKKITNIKFLVYSSLLDEQKAKKSEKCIDTNEILMNIKPLSLRDYEINMLAIQNGFIARVLFNKHSKEEMESLVDLCHTKISGYIKLTGDEDPKFKVLFLDCMAIYIFLYIYTSKNAFAKIDQEKFRQSQLICLFHLLNKCPKSENEIINFISEICFADASLQHIDEINQEILEIFNELLSKNRWTINLHESMAECIDDAAKIKELELTKILQRERLKKIRNQIEESLNETSASNKTATEYKKYVENTKNNIAFYNQYCAFLNISVYEFLDKNEFKIYTVVPHLTPHVKPVQEFLRSSAKRKKTSSVSCPALIRYLREIPIGEMKIGDSGWQPRKSHKTPVEFFYQTVLSAVSFIKENSKFENTINQSLHLALFLESILQVATESRLMKLQIEYLYQFLSDKTNCDSIKPDELLSLTKLYLTRWKALSRKEIIDDHFSEILFLHINCLITTGKLSEARKFLNDWRDQFSAVQTFNKFELKISKIDLEEDIKRLERIQNYSSNYVKSNLDIPLPQESTVNQSLFNKLSDMKSDIEKLENDYDTANSSLQEMKDESKSLLEAIDINNPDMTLDQVREHQRKVISVFKSAKATQNQIVHQLVPELEKARTDFETVKATYVRNLKRNISLEDKISAAKKELEDAKELHDKIITELDAANHKIAESKPEHEQARNTVRKTGQQILEIQKLIDRERKSHEEIILARNASRERVLLNGHGTQISLDAIKALNFLILELKKEGMNPEIYGSFAQRFAITIRNKTDLKIAGNYAVTDIDVYVPGLTQINERQIFAIIKRTGFIPTAGTESPVNTNHQWNYLYDQDRGFIHVSGEFHGIVIDLTFDTKPYRGFVEPNHGLRVKVVESSEEADISIGDFHLKHIYPGEPEIVEQFANLQSLSILPYTPGDRKYCLTTLKAILKFYDCSEQSASVAEQIINDAKYQQSVSTALCESFNVQNNDFYSEMRSCLLLAMDKPDKPDLCLPVIQYLIYPFTLEKISEESEGLKFATLCIKKILQEILQKEKNPLTSIRKLSPQQWKKYIDKFVNIQIEWFMKQTQQGQQTQQMSSMSIQQRMQHLQIQEMLAQQQMTMQLLQYNRLQQMEEALYQGQLNLQNHASQIPNTSDGAAAPASSNNNQPRSFR